MNKETQSLAIKILLISHSYLFFSSGVKLSGYILLITIFTFLFSAKSAMLNKKIEGGVGFLGNQLLKLVLIISYLAIIIPSRLFYRTPKFKGSSFEKRNKTDFDFRKPW
jgi:hypothetical protein